MTTTGEPRAPGRDADVDLYAVGAESIPDDGAVLLVTEIDNPDGVFVGQWSDEDTVARIFDGDLYVRLRRSTAAFPTLVDAELILAHDGQLMPITRTQNSATWAQDLRTPAAAIMTLHTDLESRLECRAYADAAITPD